MISSLVRKGKDSARRLGANTIRDQVTKATGSKRLASAAAAAFEAGTAGGCPHAGYALAGRIYDPNMQTEDTEGRKSKGGYRNETSLDLARKRDKKAAKLRAAQYANKINMKRLAKKGRVAKLANQDAAAAKAAKLKHRYKAKDMKHRRILGNADEVFELAGVKRFATSGSLRNSTENIFSALKGFPRAGAIQGTHDTGDGVTAGLPNWKRGSDTRTQANMVRDYNTGGRASGYANLVVRHSPKSM